MAMCLVDGFVIISTSQDLILDRAKVYKLMDDNGIPTSPHWIVNHSDPVDEAQFIEAEDYVVIRGVKLDKPFVEKPVCRTFILIRSLYFLSLVMSA